MYEQGHNQVDKRGEGVLNAIKQIAHKKIYSKKKKNNNNNLNCIILHDFIVFSFEGRLIFK